LYDIAGCFLPLIVSSATTIVRQCFGFFLPRLSLIRFLQMALVTTLREAMNDHEAFPMSCNPLDWWAKQDTLSPLYPLVQLFLGIPASNASAERLFSSSGFLSEGRDRLDLQTLEHLAVIRHFMLSSENANGRQELIDHLVEKLLV
jgi:hypothetical protein